MTQLYNNEDLADLVEHGIKFNSTLLNLNSSCKVIKIFPTKKNLSVYQAILEIDRVAYNSLTTHSGIFIGYDYCTVYDALEIRRCFKCNDFNHASTKCTKHRSCPRCSDDHDVKSCSATSLKCINCTRVNQSNNMNLNTEHAAWDTRCPTYTKCLDRLKQSLLTSK